MSYKYIDFGQKNKSLILANSFIYPEIDMKH